MKFQSSLYFWIMINLKFPCDQSHQKCNSFDKKTSVISNKHTRGMWFQRGRSHRLIRQFIVELMRMSQNQSQISIQEQQIKNWPKMGEKNGDTPEGAVLKVIITFHSKCEQLFLIITDVFDILPAFRVFLNCAVFIFICVMQMGPLLTTFSKLTQQICSIHVPYF